MSSLKVKNIDILDKYLSFFPCIIFKQFCRSFWDKKSKNNLFRVKMLLLVYLLYCFEGFDFTICLVF